jgi:hypothetical protein
MSEMQDDNILDVEKPKRIKRRRLPRKRIEKVEEKGKMIMPEYKPVKVPIRCLYGGGGNEIRDNGPVTGIEYKFHPGEVTLVDERDVKGLLARKTNPKKPCCGRKVAAPLPLYGIA